MNKSQKIRIRRLIDEYNRDPSRFNDMEAEQIAMLAKAIGVQFKRSSKPLRNLAFSLANTATFGLLPNSLRPRSRGESVYGRTGLDSIASGIGTLGGLGVGGFGAFRGLTRLAPTPFGQAGMRMGRQGYDRARRAVNDLKRRMNQRMSQMGRNVDDIGAMGGLPQNMYSYRPFNAKERVMDFVRRHPYISAAGGGIAAEMLLSAMMDDSPPPQMDINGVQYAPRMGAY